MPREELRSRLQERLPGLSGKLFNQLIALAAHKEIVGQSEASVWSADHRVTLTPEQQRNVDQLLSVFRRAPYTTPSVTECVSKLGGELFNALIEEGALIRLSEDVVYLGETVAEMRERVAGHIRHEGSITVAQVRDLFGASRKYALALMEYLDEQRVTRRVGDARVLR
jgi:selenocysteine-specific elongation factor